MSARRRLASFMGAAAAIGLAALVARACPGGCGNCALCATALVPLGASASAVGLALGGSALARCKEAAMHSEDDSQARRE